MSPSVATIGVGAAVNDGTGDPFRTAFRKINASPGINSPMPGLGWFNLQAWGAVGDGVTDDTVNIQACFDACAAALGGIVYIPPGNYIISNTINVGGNVVVFGEGDASRFTASGAFPTSNGMMNLAGRANATLRSFGLFGNTGSLPLNCLQLVTCTDCKILYVDVRNASHEGISLNHGCYDCLIQGCQVDTISGVNGWGIGLFWDIKRCSVLGNTVRDCGAYGIIVDDGTSGQTDNLPCLRNVISGNVVESITSGMWGIGIEGSSENVVTGNIVSCVSTYGILCDIGNSTTVFASDKNTITGNFVRATNGIRVSGSYNRIQGNTIDAGDTGIVCAQTPTLASVGNSIRDNTILGLATSGNKIGIQCSDTNFSELRISDNYIPSSGQWGIFIQAGGDHTISNNRIRNTQKEAIKFLGTIDGLTIRGNDILNAGVAAVDTYSAIHIEATGASVTNCRVVDNIINDDQVTKTTWSGVLMKGTGAVFTATQVARNVVLRNTVQDLIFLSGPTTIEADAFATVASGTSLNPSSAQDQRLIVLTASGGNLTVGTFSHIPKFTRFTVAILQDATGARTVTWNAAYRLVWSDTGNTANKYSSVSFFYDGTSFIQVSPQTPYV